MAHPLSKPPSWPKACNDLPFLNSPAPSGRQSWPIRFFPSSRLAMNNPSYRMKSLLDESVGSLVSHTIAEEERSQEDESSSQNERSGRFDSLAENMDRGSDVACQACGFESTFVHEGMRPCNRCRAAFYCSDHCRSWDWNSGGHRKVCQQILSGSYHSVDRLSSRGSESGSSLDADSLFDRISGTAEAVDTSRAVEKRGLAGKNNALSAKKSLSSYLDKPKTQQQSSVLPNPFANMEENDQSEGCESDTFEVEGNEEESLCVSNINVDVNMPLNAITEESQISEAITADASWRNRETPPRPPRNSDEQHALGEHLSQHDSEGDVSVDYGNQDPRTLQADDDVAYGVEFGRFGHQSTNSLSANCDTTFNDDIRSIVEHEHGSSALLELFDSKATGSYGLLDSTEQESFEVTNIPASDAAYANPSSTNSSASSIASMSTGDSASEEDVSHRTLGDRSESDKSLLKQFREVYNRPENNGVESDDFKSPSQRSTSSLREFREIYNTSRSDTSDSSSVQSENDDIPRSFLGSMNLDNPGDESELEVPNFISTEQSSGTTDTSIALQQARERFSAKRDTLNEALIHYKHRFGESAAVEALDKFSRSKEVNSGSEIEYQWERTNTSDETKTRCVTHRPLTAGKNQLGPPGEGDTISSTDNGNLRDLVSGGVDRTAEALIATDDIPSSGSDSFRYSSYKRSLKRSDFQVNGSEVSTSTVGALITNDTMVSTDGESSRYLSYKRSLKGSNHQLSASVEHTSPVGDLVPTRNMPSNESDHFGYVSYRSSLKGSNCRVSGVVDNALPVGDLVAPDKMLSTDGGSSRYFSYKRSLKGSSRQLSGSGAHTSTVGDLVVLDSVPCTKGERLRYSSYKRSLKGRYQQASGSLHQTSLVEDLRAPDKTPSADSERLRYLSYKRSLNGSNQLVRGIVDQTSMVEATDIGKENYRTYRRRLNHESTNSMTQEQSIDLASVNNQYWKATEESVNQVGTSLSTRQDEAEYCDYVYQLRKGGNQNNPLKRVDEKLRVDVDRIANSNTGKYSMYRNILASTTSSLSTDETVHSALRFDNSNLHKDSASDGQCRKEDVDTATSFTKHPEMDIDTLISTKQQPKANIYQRSRYDQYRGNLTSSGSNERVGSRDHQFSKDDANVKVTKGQAMEACRISDHVPSYADYRRTLIATLPEPVHSAEIATEDYHKSIDPSVLYFKYRRSVNTFASVQGGGAEGAFHAERNSTSSPLASYHEYRNSLLSSKRCKPTSSEEPLPDSSDEQSHNVKRKQNTVELNSSCSPSSPLKLAQLQTDKEVDSTITRSWYRNYRESLDPDVTSDGGDKSLVHERVHNSLRSNSESITHYENYRQNLRVRFKSPLKEKAEAVRAEITHDDSHNSGFESVVPERMPEVIASPTSRSTSSVTSNTDIDNTDATLMPRYLYYKFSLEKAELALKDKIEEVSTENMVHNSDAAEDCNTCLEGNSNALGFEKSKIHPVELNAEMKRDIDLLGLSRSVAWHDGGCAYFLRLWKQVAQDVAITTEGRTKALASKLRVQSTFNLNMPVPTPEIPLKAVKHPFASPQPSADTSPEVDIENQQTDPNSNHVSAASVDENCRKERRLRSLLFLFLRHGIPPLILILFSLGIGLVVARSRREIGSAETKSPSAAPSTSVLSPSLGRTTLPPAAQAEVYDTLYEVIANISFDGGQSLENPSSHQAMAFNWLLKTPKLFEQYTTERIIQRYSLVCFYFSTDGANWLTRKSWLSYTDECTWHSLAPGNICNENGFYTSLDLSYNNLGGFLPSELSLLTDLTTLHLSGSGVSPITGPVPTELGGLTNLQAMNLRDNAFIGGLPTELGQLTGLTNMDLGMNAFSLRIPSEFGLLSSLKVLNLEMNILTGEVPSEITKLRKLQKLALGSNRMSGRVQVGHELSALKFLHLEQNRFTSLSPGLGKLSQLEVFTMYETDVTGNLQSEISQLVSLKRLILHSNRLFGRLPDFIGNLKGLLDLDLSFNAFSGPIPTHIGKLQNLTRLDLRANFLAGTIPDELGLLTNASIIRIDDNDITGAVSTAVCRSFESLEARFYLDCGASEVSCPPESTCCSFCCIDGQGCECRLPEQLNNLCFAH